MEKHVNIMIVSGYFNPLHKGHLDYFENAKSQGDFLWVIVNNDKQRALKGSKEFMLESERIRIVRALSVVDYAVLAHDSDRTVCDTLRHLHHFARSEWFLKDRHTLHFCNAGDQTNESIPEVDVCNELGINLVDGLGKKIQSSSWLLGK